MIDQQRSRRTLLPLVLLLGGLLGAGPFVPRTFAADQPTMSITTFEIPALAAGLGLALALAAMAGIVIARRRRRAQDPPAGQDVDPLLAALRGPAAFAPDDLDARLDGRTTVGSPASGGSGPRWIRQIESTGGSPPAPDPDEPAGDWSAGHERALVRR